MDEEKVMENVPLSENIISMKKRSFVATVVVVALACSFIGAGIGVSLTNRTSNSETSDKLLSLNASPVAKTATTETTTSNFSQSPAVMIAQKVGPAVVGISNKSSAGNYFGGQDVEQGSGSGIIINNSGYIVTNNHVVQGAEQLTVSLSDGRKVNAKLVGTDSQTDLAVLKIDAKNLTAAVMGDSSKLKAGEMVVAIGNPMGEEFAGSITQGVISALNRSITIGEREANVIQTDAAINPGNSGGALVNAQGEVIGINSAKISISGIEGMGFAIPISDAKPIINQLIEKGHIVRPWLGIQGVASDATNGNSKTVDGVLIAAIVDGSPASSAGLQEGDIIKSINGQNVKDMNELKNILLKLKPKDKITLKISRNKTDKDISVVLDEMPSQIQTQTPYQTPYGIPNR